jgi:hypothetical protein
MSGKSGKQRRKELNRRREMQSQRPLTKLDLVKIGKSLDRGQKW